MGGKNVGNCHMKSSLRDMTIFYGATDDSVWDGNSFFFQLHGCKYMFIGDWVFTFEVNSEDIMERFSSNMGNNNIIIQSHMEQK